MALFETISEFRTYGTSVTSNTKLELLLPYIEQAELKYIKPLLGADEYNLFVTNFTGTLTAAQTALKPYLQKALHNYTMYLAAPFLNVGISSTGIKETITDESSPATKWRTEDFKKSSIEMADMFAEEMLSFLEANKSDYSLWSASSAYTQTKDRFINSAKEFDEFVRINESRRTFLALKTAMKLAEEKHIKKALCSDLYDKLKADFLAGTISGKYATLFTMLKDAVAHLTIYEAIPKVTLTITDSAISVSSISDGYSDKRSAGYQVIQNLKDESLNNGSHFLAECVAWIEHEDNIGDLTEYKDSDCYSSNADSVCSVIDNASSTSFAI